MTADRDVELLTELPAIGPLIAKAAISGKKKKSGVATALPKRTVMVREVDFDIANLADYSRLLGMTLSNHVPSTYLHVQSFALQVQLMAAKDFPYPMAGMIHIANAMTLYRPVGVTETVSLTSSAGNLSPHRSGLTVDLTSEARVGDELVWRGDSTYLVKGGAVPAALKARTQEPSEADDAGAEVLRPWAQWPTSSDLGRRYAAVAGDVNPIHMSGLAAKAFGFPKAIAHGMWTHAKVMAALEGRVPASYTVSVRFNKPILLGSTVVLRAGTSGSKTQFEVSDKAGKRVHLTGQIVPV